MTADAVLLDRLLAQFGPDARPSTNSCGKPSLPWSSGCGGKHTPGRTRRLQRPLPRRRSQKSAGLPQTKAQRSLKAPAIQLATDRLARIFSRFGERGSPHHKRHRPARSYEGR